MNLQKIIYQKHLSMRNKIPDHQIRQIYEIHNENKQNKINLNLVRVFPNSLYIIKPIANEIEFVSIEPPFQHIVYAQTEQPIKAIIKKYVKKRLVKKNVLKPQNNVKTTNGNQIFTTNINVQPKLCLQNISISTSLQTQTCLSTPSMALSCRSTDTNKVNLVIACYFGRKIGDTHRNGSIFNIPVQDKMYITKHINSLTKYNHNLAQITFVIAKDTTDTTQYIINYRELIPNMIHKTPVHILERDNNGLSFGSYKYAIQTYKNQFDFYILIEDDYIFVQHNFDKILLNGINKSQCEYFVIYKGVDQWFPLGIIKTSTLEKKKWLTNVQFEGRNDGNERVWKGLFSVGSFDHNNYINPYYTRSGFILFYTKDKNTSAISENILIVPNEMLTVDGEILFPLEIYKVNGRADIIKLCSTTLKK